MISAKLTKSWKPFPTQRSIWWPSRFRLDEICLKGILIFNNISNFLKNKCFYFLSIRIRVLRIFLPLLLLLYIIWDYLRYLMFLDIYFIFQHNHFSCYKTGILQQNFQYFKEHFLPMRHRKVKTAVQLRCVISHKPMEIFLLLPYWAKWKCFIYSFIKTTWKDYLL